MSNKIVVLLFVLFPLFLFAQDDLPQGKELLKNNFFEDGLSNWTFYSLDSSRAEYDLDTNSVISGKNSVHVTVHNPYGDYPSGRIQLNQHNIPGGIILGNFYHISFKLKANMNIEQGFWTIYREPDYQVFYNWDWVKSKKNEVTTFSYTFKAKATDSLIYFAIDLASFANNDVELWIDDIHFIALPQPIVEPPLPHGGVELLSNCYFNEGLDKWELNVAQNEDAHYNLDSNTVLEGKYSGHIRVNNTFDGVAQQTQFFQKNLLDSVKAGIQYHVQFIAKASKSISNLYWSVNQQNNPQGGVLYSQEISLPENEVVIIADTILSFSTNELVSWSFDLGSISKDSVDIWFDAVHLMELGEAPETIFPPETTWEAIVPVDLEKPRYLHKVRDPEYGVDYTCISDPIVFGVSSGSNALLTHYPKDQAWNADMSKIVLGGNYLVNADDYTFDKALSFSTGDSRWSNTDPRIRYFCQGDKFKKIDIVTEQITILHQFPGYQCTMGPWEGNISADDKYVVITNESGGVAIGASLYDIELDSVISTKTFSSGDIDWVSVPPSGDYIVINDRGNLKLDVYDHQFNYLRTVGVGSEHGDFGVDSEGNEVWIQVIPISMHRLSDGKSTRLIEPSMGGHISGRGLKNPGWAVVSNDINKGGATGYLYATQLFEVKLDGSGTIRHFGYARTSCTTYNNYPMGSVSPDGKKVIFNSDWLFGKGSGDAVAYISEYVKRTTAVNKENISNSIRSFELIQNYPNPFNPTTVINYTLITEGMTSLVVYNILGQKVKVLINENMRAGSYSTPFNGSNLPSGLYFYKLACNGQIQVKKMLLLK